MNTPGNLSNNIKWSTLQVMGILGGEEKELRQKIYIFEELMKKSIP